MSKGAPHYPAIPSSRCCLSFRCLQNDVFIQKCVVWYVLNLSPSSREHRQIFCFYALQTTTFTTALIPIDARKNKHFIKAHYFSSRVDNKSR